MTRTTIASAVIVFVTFSAASAATPTAEDFRHCNEKAKSEMETASASPRTDAVASRPQPAGVPAGTASPEERDPQLQGIDTEGAKDPAYVAVYKSCMRQRGF